MTFTYRISQWQLFVVVALTSISLTPFGSPAVHHDFGRHIWVANLVQWLVTGAGGLLALALARRFAAGPAGRFSVRAVGPVLGWVYGFLLATYVFLWGPVGTLDTMLQLLEVMELPETSPAYPAALTLGISSFAAYLGPEVVARFAEAFSWFLLIGLVMILVIPLAEASLGALLPVDLPDPAPFYNGTTWAYVLGIRGFFLVPLYAAYLDYRRRVHRPVLAGLLAALVVVGVITTTPHLLFSDAALKTLQYPGLETMATSPITILPVESALFVTVLIWHGIGFVVVAATLYVAAALFADLFRLPHHRWLVPVLAGLAFVILRLPLQTQVRETLMVGWSLLGYVVGLVFPAAILLLRRGKRVNP